MMISILTAFTLREKAVKRKTVFAGILLALLLCLALTYSRGAWVSLAAIVLGLTLFMTKGSDSSSFWCRWCWPSITAR